MLIWRIAFGVLPTWDSISKFVPDLADLCPLCGCVPEFVVHLFGNARWPEPYGLVPWTLELNSSS